MKPGGVNDIMHRKHGLRILGIWEKSVSWVPASEEEGWFSELGEARRFCALRAPCVGWVESWQCKSSQHRKIVYLSPSCRKTFKLKKVNKSFVPELRSCKCFFVFRDSYVIYIWVMNILCTFHIWLCNIIAISPTWLCWYMWNYNIFQENNISINI